MALAVVGTEQTDLAVSPLDAAAVAAPKMIDRIRGKVMRSWFAMLREHTFDVGENHGTYL